MAYKLITCDLDGTLIRNDYSLSAENEAAIAQIAAKGVCFVPTTGRAYDQVLATLRNNPHIRFIVCSDGAVIYDKAENRQIKTCLNADQTAAVVNTVLQYDTFPAFHSNGFSYFDMDKHTHEQHVHCGLNAYYQQYFYHHGTPTANFQSFARQLTEIELASVFFHSNADRDACMEKLNRIDGVTAIAPGPHYMEAHSSNAGKGKAVQTLTALLNLQKENVIAMGDSHNDTSMFREAGLALAVGNAPDDVKAMADAVICSNEDHAAPYVLEHYL